MSPRAKTTAGFLAAAALLMLVSVSSLVRVSQLREHSTLSDVLFIPSAKAVKRMSLGYNGLLADIYWTRAVQYFGNRHMARAQEYDMLDPLLDITVSLDPKLKPAYSFGSIFLSQKPPQGAGRPDLAVKLVERGIKELPDDWNLYFLLGFIHYMERHDYIAAAEAFERGSRVPNAHPFLRVMAARMRTQGGDRETARLLWQNIYDTNPDKTMRKNAVEHLDALRYDQAIEQIQQRVQLAKDRLGRMPTDWQEVVRAGLLRGIPLDPKGRPLILMPDGRVQYSRPDDFPFIQLGLPKYRSTDPFPGKF
jgi:tetratricopeptide (TPR) repeat protein